MATLYIAEYARMAQDSAGKVVPIPGDEVATQAVSYTGTAGQSAAFNNATRFIGITSEGIFSYAVGSNPTATTSKFRVPADTIIYLKVHPGDKISAITNT